jgi:hypothetical protein
MSSEYDVEDFKKKYPRLADELLRGKTKHLKLKVELIDPWRGYVPTVVDYIRRCKSIEEANEVLDYLVKRSELTIEEAEKYREILRNGGIEAFGGRKEDNYYYKEARRFWSRIRREQIKSELEPGEEEPT